MFLSRVIIAIFLCSAISGCSDEKEHLPPHPYVREIYERGIEYRIQKAIKAKNKPANYVISAEEKSDIRKNMLHIYTVDVFVLRGLKCVIFVPKRDGLGGHSLICFDEKWNVVEKEEAK